MNPLFDVKQIIAGFLAAIAGATGLALILWVVGETVEHFTP